METNEPKTEETKMAKKVTANVPQNEAILSGVALKAAETWKIKPFITLVWISCNEFTVSVVQYSTEIQNRQSARASMTPYVQELRLKDVMINKGVKQIKNYLEEKYDKDIAISYYSQFGISKQKNQYKIPAMQDKRATALKLMLEGLVTHGFQDKKYGLSYWQPISDGYSETLKHITDTTGAVSKQVGDKQQLKKVIRQTLESLILIIKANYPDTYESVLREWGFQKEKY